MSAGGRRRQPFVSLPNEPRFFDAHPTRIGGFELRGEQAIPADKEPTLSGWTAALQFANGAYESSPFWIGDLVAYAETRAQWREKLDQAIAVTGLTEQRLHDLGYVSRRVGLKERALAPSHAHARAVASLPSSDQAALLEKAATEGWTAAKLREIKHRRHRPTVVSGQATLEGMYRVIYAAPRWSQFAIADLCKLPVREHAAPASVLFMWTPAHVLLANPGAREVLDAWGFTYRTNAVWDRVVPSFGSYVQATHEHLVIATRGECLPDAPDQLPKSVFVERRRVDDYESKPAAIRRQWIERLYVRGPFLELFGTEPVAGWSVFGSDPRRWGREAAGEAATATVGIARLPLRDTAAPNCRVGGAP